jgi:hypothetical protein
MISWVLPSHIPSRTNRWPANLRDDQEIVLWVEENSHVMLFCQQSLPQLSHIFWAIFSWAPSIYAMWISYWLCLVMIVMTNDRWCRDETESLLWCTHGWAARHALVSRLIVMLDYETTLMCYLLWTFSQSDRCILSQHAAIVYPNLLTVSCHIPSHEIASIFSLGVTCFSTLKAPHSNLETRFF